MKPIKLENKKTTGCEVSVYFKLDQKSSSFFENIIKIDLFSNEYFSGLQGETGSRCLKTVTLIWNKHNVHFIIYRTAYTVYIFSYVPFPENL